MSLRNKCMFIRFILQKNKNTKGRRDVIKTKSLKSKKNGIGEHPWGYLCGFHQNWLRHFGCRADTHTQTDTHTDTQTGTQTYRYLRLDSNIFGQNDCINWINMNNNNLFIKNMLYNIIYRTIWSCHVRQCCCFFLLIRKHENNDW